MSVSTRTRFEVFKRDNFSCQYCGQSAPDVELHADHIEPKSLGGSDSMDNLITSCADCNLGKTNRRIMALVKPCHFCKEGDAMYQWAIPDGMESLKVPVCRDCLRNSVWALHYCCKPDYIHCAGCGVIEKNEGREQCEPWELVRGTLAWVCDHCASEWTKTPAEKTSIQNEYAKA